MWLHVAAREAEKCSLSHALLNFSINDGEKKYWKTTSNVCPRVVRKGVLVAPLMRAKK